MVQTQMYATKEQMLFPWQVEYLVPDLHRCECQKCSTDPNQIINTSYEACYKARLEGLALRKVKLVHNLDDNSTDSEDSDGEAVPSPIPGYHGNSPSPAFSQLHKTLKTSIDDECECRKWIWALETVQPLVREGIDLNLLAKMVDGIMDQNDTRESQKRLSAAINRLGVGNKRKSGDEDDVVDSDIQMS